MEPKQQMEIQLGHMCNNRCVFCVSGQRTAMREAFPLAGDPILAEIRSGYEQGMRKLTLLGGEPTIQPEFMNIVRFAVEIGFDEIVIFTNGVKTARAEFVDEILATGGNFTFRFSFQGANLIAHERTTKKLGSFGRLVQSMRNVHARKKPITVNMCVVRSNYESVADFPKLLLPFDARQLHLDMVRPLDAGVRTVEEMREMVPRYSDMVPHLEKMVAGFPEGFDVNIGNLPYCIAPHLARYIHHDGERTFTVSVDEEDKLSKPWDKYEVKRRDKLKRDACRDCVFDDQCSGVFETYRDFYGMDELVPVTPERLVEIDPALQHFTLHLRPYLARLDGWTPPEPFGAPAIRVNSRDHEVVLSFPSEAGDLVAALRRPATGGLASTDRFALHLLAAPDSPSVIGTVRSLFARLCGDDLRVVHPVAEDTPLAGVRSTRSALDPRIGLRLRKLRASAPFGALSWRDVEVGGAGREAALTLADPRGEKVRVTLAIRGTTVAGGYQLENPGAPPSAELVDGLRSLMGALRAG